ncbi:ankyrin repeat-containing protein [Rivularia sp. PCC 7116]|nr:ankyrin repeat domain-containing protein [Rivularia sp. PCC 7116]AFY58890.1 ankyrin repeat-containing protein [Rivularia sp. PCC 7116]
METGNLDKVKLIFPFTPSRDDSSFWWKSPLFYPIKYNYAEILEWLVLEGFDIEETDEYLNTPLMEAAESGATDCVRILFEVGADINKVDSCHQNAISKAANLEIVEILLSENDDFSDISDEIRVSLLDVGDEELQLREIKDKSQTLVGNHIYIIGNNGYQNQRVLNETPVYRLNCDSFKIEKIETIGNKPGWISQHKAKFQQPSQIYISGGKLWTQKAYIENSIDYILDLTNFKWSRINS